LTVIVPVMNGWAVQWYEYVPAVLKVYVNVSPLANDPESKTPSSDVAVCVVWPVFVQQTAVPTGTVMSAGSKKKSASAICVDPVGQALGT